MTLTKNLNTEIEKTDIFASVKERLEKIRTEFCEFSDAIEDIETKKLFQKFFDNAKNKNEQIEKIQWDFDEFKLYKEYSQLKRSASYSEVINEMNAFLDLTESKLKDTIVSLHKHIEKVSNLIEKENGK